MFVTRGILKFSFLFFSFLNLLNEPGIWPDVQYGGWRRLPNPFSFMKGFVEQGQGLVAAQEEPFRLLQSGTMSL